MIRITMMKRGQVIYIDTNGDIDDIIISYMDKGYELLGTIDMNIISKKR